MKGKRIIDENDNEKFYVEISEELDDDTLLITSNKEFSQKLIKNALSSYAGSEKTYSKNLTEQSLMSTSLTETKIEQLAKDAQNNLTKIQEINTYIDLYLNKDDIIGKTYEIIEANTNANFQLSYPEIEGRNKQKTLDGVKEFINQFNKQIELKELITETIPYAYANGNRIMYLRKTDYNTFQVDKYPLGMAQISDYKINNEPLVYLSIPDIISRLVGNQFTTGYTWGQITLKLYESLDEQIRSNFPIEVYRSYLEKDKYNIVKLNTDLTSVIRTNNRGKRYGLSPIFKALSPALKLEIQEKSDSSDSKARAKKIIFQQINEKLLGEDGTDVDLGMTVYSHQELIKAWQNEVVLYTGSPAVVDLKYVEPKSTTDHFNTLNYYKNKVLSALGISFLNGESKQGEVSAKLNFTELMRVINRISEQLEHDLNKWYKYALKDAGLPVEYAPTIKVLDSELLEMELRISLSEKLFNSFGASFATAYELLGFDYNKEKELRAIENEQKLDEEVFYPRMNANTFSAKGEEEYIYNKNDGTDNKDKQNKTLEQKVKDGEE